MITAILLSPLVYVPSLLVNRYSLPKTAYVSVLALLCLWRLRDGRHWPHVGFAGLFVLGLLLSARNAINLLQWWMQVSLDLTGLVVFYYVVNFSRFADLNRHVSILGVVSLIVGLSGYFGAYLGLDLDLHDGRGGTQGNPTFAALVVGVGTVALWHTKGWVTRALAVPAALLLIHIWSRTTLVFVGLAMLFSLLRRYFAIWLLAVMAALLVASWVPWARWQDRTKLWDASIQAYQDFPVFGVGRGNAGLFLPLYTDYGRDKVYVSRQGERLHEIDAMIHNDVLQLLMEAPLALVGFLGLVLSVIAGNLGSQHPTALLSMLIVFGGHLVMNFPFESAEQTALFWVILGWIYVEKNTPIALTHERSPFREL